MFEQSVVTASGQRGFHTELVEDLAEVGIFVEIKPKPQGYE